MSRDSRATPLLKGALQDFTSGRLREARATLSAVLRREPHDAAALHLLGIIEYQAGEQRLAHDLLGAAARAPNATALHLLSYAELCCKPHDLQSGIDAVRRALLLDSQLPLAWLCLGRLLFEARDYAESHRCFERTLQLQPDCAAARCGLANALGRLGETLAAVAEFDALLAAQPDNAEARDSYALLLQDLGRLPAALEQAEAAAAARPEVLEFQIRAADIERLMGRHWPALCRLTALPAKGHGDVNILTQRAHLLRLVDQFEAAADLCREALAQGGESAELLRAYGLALELDGKDADALALFDRAAELAVAAPRSRAMAWSDKGVLLTHLGRFEEAAASFDRAIACEPTLAEAWYNKSNLERCLPGDPSLPAMQRLLESSFSHHDRLLLHFALGKSLLDVGDVDAAFGHWHRANRLKRTSIDYDAAAASRDLHAIARRPFPASPPADPQREPRSELPVFVVGMPRSGSSLVEQILASHPEVHGASEQLQLRAWFEQAAAAPHDLPAPAIATAILAKLTRLAPRASRVIDKDLENFQHLGIIHAVLPRARIIHCRRDPLDTCLSAYTKLFVGDMGFTYDLAELGRYYRDYHALMAHWRACLPREIFLELDYEDLVAEPQRTSRQLIDFLGLPWHDACSRYFATERAVRTASAGAVRRPIYRSSVGRARAVRAHLGPLIEALGDLAP